jgi:hypothetical protein
MSRLFHVSDQPDIEVFEPRWPPPAHVIAIESAWLECARATTLWVYECAPAAFVCSDATAGYFVAQVRVVPARCRRVDGPLAFSCIRMRNAGKGPPGI